MKQSTSGEAGDYVEPPRPLHPLIYALRKRRYELNISQKALAMKLGYCAKALQHWETGVSEPRMMALCDWAQALGMKIEVTK